MTKAEGGDDCYDESRTVRDVEQYCADIAGVDLAYPYVLELNLANPVGLNYSLRPTGIDQSNEAIEYLFRALEREGVLRQSVVGG